MYVCVCFSCLQSSININRTLKKSSISNMSGLEYFLRVKTFNSPIDITHLLPKLTTDWECSIHSYFLNLERSGANPEVEVMRLTCNAIEFNKSLKQQHLIEVLVNTVKLQHVKTF